MNNAEHREWLEVLGRNGKPGRKTAGPESESSPSLEKPPKTLPPRQRADDFID